MKYKDSRYISNVISDSELTSFLRPDESITPTTSVRCYLERECLLRVYNATYISYSAESVLWKNLSLNLFTVCGACDMLCGKAAADARVGRMLVQYCQF